MLDSWSSGLPGNRNIMVIIIMGKLDPEGLFSVVAGQWWGWPMSASSAPRKDHIRLDRRSRPCGWDASRVTDGHDTATCSSYDSITP